MKIGIIGAGQIGGTLTRRFTALEHKVAVANSRGPETLADLAAETGAKLMSVEEAAKFGEVVVVTIPEKNIPYLPRNLFAATPVSAVIVDTGNYYPRQRDGKIHAIETGLTESRWVAQQLNRPVVKATFDNKVSILTSGQVDITIAPLLQTPEREKIVDFITYSMSAQCLFGLATNPKVAQAKSLDDLNRSDVTIAYIIGSPQGAWLEKRLPRAKQRGVPGSVADVAIEEITSHRADVANIDKFFFSGLAKKVPGLISVPKEYLTSRELSIPVGMAINKNQPEFLAWLRAVAEAIRPQLTAEEEELEKAGS